MSDFPSSLSADERYQRQILQGVSRTFALTIPQLPGPLRSVVSNAYLLCRVADTIEDEPSLAPRDKRRFAEVFVDVVDGGVSAESFAAELAPRLSAATLNAERELVSNVARIVRITHGFEQVPRAALLRCVRIMSRGMSEFQQNPTLGGLKDLGALDSYCYHVAGVVGEMLTELFCDYSEEIGRHRAELLHLSVSFGQGLQMTNILKDIWEDRRRGACWLPREVFASYGFDLKTLREGDYDPAFGRGLRALVAVASRHLDDALRYTLLLPRRETGLRRFCLWAIGMAVLTLRRINAHPDFSAGAQVKISRRSVRATVLVTSLSAGHDVLLRALFAASTRGLPAVLDGARFQPTP